MTVNKELTINSAAKINLYLNVSKNLRADGYHEIKSIMQSISLSDELHFKVSDKSEEERNLLRNKVRDKEKEISELQEELRKKQAGFGINIIPNSTPYATLSDVGHTYLNNIIIGRAEPDLNNSSWAIAEQDKNKELKEDDD